MLYYSNYIVLVLTMKLITEESLHRPEVLRWHKRMLERYAPPDYSALTIVLPCSAKKPYSKSKSHQKFMKHIKRGAGGKVGLVHEVIMTSPLGLVPRELERIYPAGHYDVPVTGHWSFEEKEISTGLMTDYIQKADTHVIAHVDGVYRDICSNLGIPLTKEKILSDESLADLESKIKSSLEGIDAPRVNRRIGGLKRVCDFQFGKGASEYLISGNPRINGYQVFCDDLQVGSINPRTGYLALSFKGGEFLRDFGSYIVTISFRPESNNIFSIGVVEADSKIRPGEEVVVLFEDEVVGVGKAVLNGDEMVIASKGLALVLRHRK